MFTDIDYNQYPIYKAYFNAVIREYCLIHGVTLSKWNGFK